MKTYIIQFQHWVENGIGKMVPRWQDYGETPNLKEAIKFADNMNPDTRVLEVVHINPKHTAKEA